MVFKDIIYSIHQYAQWVKIDFLGDRMEKKEPEIPPMEGDVLRRIL